MSGFRYHFRFCCDPEYNGERESDALLRFVREAQIDDVLVFANVQEINTGHTTPEEQAVYVRLMENLKPRLERAGVTLSVNPWHTLMHGDMGKRLREDQPFRAMVDLRGRKSALCVCPLCEAWRAYFLNLYREYARLAPAYLWLEDDFRFHNHEPLEWGGCFCEAHMAAFAEAAGEAMTREAFVEGLLKPGEPHPYRKIWLDACRDTLIELAGEIARAVHEVSPETKLSLMSSAPQLHAAEGRDWRALMGALGGACRVHLPCYGEMTPARYLFRFHAISMLCRAMLPGETEVLPELENYPYSRYAKSAAFTRFQLFSALPLNVAGMTIDLFDLNGGGIRFDEGYQNTLREAKPGLCALNETSVFAREMGGVRVLFAQTSSYTLHTPQGASMDELSPDEGWWGGMLASFGIPYVYTDELRQRGQIVAASGQALRNYAADALEALFAENLVLLTGDAAEALFDMGLGHLAGIRSCEWVQATDGTVAYEQMENGARASAMILSPDLLRIEYEPGMQALSHFYASDRQCAFPAVARFDNALIFPFGRTLSPVDPPEMLLTSARGELLRGAISAHPAAPPMIADAPYLAPTYYPREGGFDLFLVNASTDTYAEFSLLYNQNILRAERLTADGWAALPVSDNRIACPLAAMECALLRVEVCA